MFFRHRLCPHLMESLRHLPWWRRLRHPRLKKHTIGVSLGLGLMIVCPALSNIHLEWVPNLLWHFVCWFGHAVGFIPLAHHVEPVWKVLMNE